MSDSQNSRILTIVAGIALIAACVIFFIWQQQRASYRIPPAAHAASLKQDRIKISYASLKQTPESIEQSRLQSLKRCGPGQLVWITGDASQNMEYHTPSSLNFGKGYGTYACLSDVFDVLPVARE